MNTRTCIIIVCFALLQASVHAQVAVSDHVSLSAQSAVQKLGLEIMKGNFLYGYKRIYPRWKQRLAKRYGSIEKLDSAMHRASLSNGKSKVLVASFYAEKPVSFFSVWPSKKIDSKTGKEIIFEHWLAVVPTLTRVRVADPQRGGKIRTLEERGFTIVISEKQSNEWFFLTGMEPKVQDLRSLFPSLPSSEAELGLPEAQIREIKQPNL